MKERTDVPELYLYGVRPAKLQNCRAFWKRVKPPVMAIILIAIRSPIPSMLRSSSFWRLRTARLHCPLLNFQYWHKFTIFVVQALMQRPTLQI